ncbi:TonB-dependent receptor [Sinorhizobium meliloti]|nr:TonB-dependent receptor [Sinorhizobium meliloti]
MSLRSTAHGVDLGPLYIAGRWSFLRVQPGWGARFVGSSYGNDQNTFKNSSRVLFDASVGYDFAAIDQKYEGLHLQVNATNLFDRREAVCTAGYCHRDQGRTVIGSLRYNW